MRQKGGGGSVVILQLISLQSPYWPRLKQGNSILCPFSIDSDPLLSQYFQSRQVSYSALYQALGRFRRTQLRRPPTNYSTLYSQLDHPLMTKLKLQPLGAGWYYRLLCSRQAYKQRGVDSNKKIVL